MRGRRRLTSRLEAQADSAALIHAPTRAIHVFQPHVNVANPGCEMSQCGRESAVGEMVKFTAHAPIPTDDGNGKRTARRSEACAEWHGEPPEEPRPVRTQPLATAEMKTVATGGPQTFGLLHCQGKPDERRRSRVALAT